MLHGRLLPNHSYVSIEELGMGVFDSLLCLTNKDIYYIDPREGEWHFPNGTRLLRYTGWGFYRDRLLKAVRLHQGVSSVGAFGMFYCKVNDSSNVPHTLYAGVFPSQGGNESAWSNKISIEMCDCRCIGGVTGDSVPVGIRCSC